MSRLRNLWRRFTGRRAPPIWTDPRYRLPLPGLESQKGLEPRRADFVASYLVDAGIVRVDEIRRPNLVSYEHLGLVHPGAYLHSLTHATTLAQIFASDEATIPVAEILRTVRLACGATLAAARESLEIAGPALNLLGGFHHAGRSRGGGLCAVNDMAVATRVLRASGFRGRVAILDTDAHPPDGTADCFGPDDGVWLGSLSGSDWGPLPNVDETVLAPGTSDAEYLDALRGLLSRMPPCDLAFVIAGGDVLGGDRFGLLGLTLDGTRRRDQMILAKLQGIASVWLPGGGYTTRAWRVLANTALVLAQSGIKRIPESYDPLQRGYARVAAKLEPERLRGGWDLDLSDVAAELGISNPARALLLGYYTTAGIEHAVAEYGIGNELRRLGYLDVRAAIERVSEGDHVRILGKHAGQEHTLIESVMSRGELEGRPVLFVNWLSLTDPRAHFSPNRPRLPGQSAPGLGLAREIGEILGRIAARLELEGVVFVPSWYHVAFTARHRFRFVDSNRQRRFEQMLRDLREIPLLEATTAIASGRVLLDGAPYTWEAVPMVYWLESPGELSAPDGSDSEEGGPRFILTAEAKQGTRER